MARAERGQVALESALVLPLMVFFTLGIVQLAMVQQARLMTEYATYQAARAGIVWNGNNERMHDAAVMALLPTMGRTDSWAKLAETWERHRGYDRDLKPLPWGVGRTQVNGQSLTGQVRIDTIGPNLTQSSYAIWKLAAGSTWLELDFDGPETYPESPALESHVQKLFDLPRADPEEDRFREATLLEIRLRYWYELRIPFANQVVFLAWYAANADTALYGAIERSSTQKQNMLGRSGDTRSLRGTARGLWDPSGRGLTPVLPSEMVVLWDMASGALPVMGAERRFFLPLQATHAMRLQSNFYRKWLVH